MHTINLPVPQDVGLGIGNIYCSSSAPMQEQCSGTCSNAVDNFELNTAFLIQEHSVQVTPADVEFIRKHTSGYICVGMEGSTLDRLQLPLMIDSEENEEAMYTAFTVTVDAREGISTGISASDRARTLRMLADPATQPSQLRRPGHICPLRYSFTLCVKALVCL